MKQRAIEQGRALAEPDYEPIEMPRNSPTGFVTAFFAVVTGFALIWHIWWLAIVGLVGAFADLRGLRLARRRRISRSRPRRSRGSTAPSARGARRPGRRAAMPGITPVEASRTGRTRSGQRGADPADGGHGGPAPKRIVVGYGFWIFLLSDIIMFSAFFAAYAVLSHATAGGPTTGELFDLHDRRDRDRLPARVELHLRPGHARGQRAQLLWTQVGAAVTGLLGLGFLALELREFARMIAERRRSRAQRLPLGLLHAGRLPRAARDDRPAVARHDDGAVLRQGLPADICAGCSASPCSGTRSTSSGSASSPSSIFWGRSSCMSRSISAHGTPRLATRAATARGHGSLEGVAQLSDRAGARRPGLTVASFWVAAAPASIYGPGVPIALAALAIAQMGVHLVFFLHITTGPDNTNNVLALAFGALIVGWSSSARCGSCPTSTPTWRSRRDDGPAHAALAVKTKRLAPGWNDGNAQKAALAGRLGVIAQSYPVLDVAGQPGTRGDPRKAAVGGKRQRRQARPFREQVPNTSV